MASCFARRALTGSTFTVYFLVHEGSCPAEEFLGELAEGDTRASHKTTLALERLANRGIPVNREVCDYLEADLWELRPFPVRMFFFRRAERIYVTHGFKRKCQRTPKPELERARRLRAAFVEGGEETE